MRDSDGYGISVDETSTYVATDFGRGTGQNDSRRAFDALYKFSRIAYGRTSYVGCLLTDEPQDPIEPTSCFDNNPAAVLSMSITEKTDLPFYQSTDKFGFAGCLYNISYTENTSQDWKNTCYDFNLTRIDVSSDTSSAAPDLSLYQCELEQELACYENNSAAVESFTINQKQSLPLTVGRFNFAGCAYNVQQTPNTSQNWTGSCYDYTLTRFDLTTSSSNILPSLSACTTEPDTSDDEDVQQVLNNQSDLSSNDSTIISNQNDIQNQLSSMATSLESNQNLIVDNQQILESDLNTVLDNQSTLQSNQEVLSSNDSTIISNQNTLQANQDILNQNDSNIISNQGTIRDDIELAADLLTNNDEILSDKIDELGDNSDVVDELKALHQTLLDNREELNNLIHESSGSSVDQHAQNGRGFLDSIISETLENEKILFDESLLSQVNSTAAGGANSSISQESSSPWFDKFNAIFPDPQQCDIDIPNILTGGTIPLSTEWSVKLKQILAWVIAFYTFLSLFEILFTPVSPKN